MAELSACWLCPKFMLFTILVIVLVLALIGGLPNSGFGYNGAGNYGWAPSSLFGLLVIVLVILLLTGRL
jgi:hypothetical protein